MKIVVRARELKMDDELLSGGVHCGSIVRLIVYDPREDTAVVSFFKPNSRVHYPGSYRLEVERPERSES